MTKNEAIKDKSSTIDDGLMDMEQVAEYLKVSVKTIYGWVRLKKIPVTKLGRLNRFKKDTIDQWVDRHTVQPMILPRVKSLTSTNWYDNI